MEIDKFLIEYFGPGREASCSSHRCRLRRFEKFLDMLGLPIDKVERCHLKHFTTWVATAPNPRTGDRGPKANAVRAYLTAINSYFRWLQHHHPEFGVPSDGHWFHGTAGYWNILDGVQDGVIASCTGWATEQDIAIVQMFRRTTITIRELVRLNKNSIAISTRGDESNTSAKQGIATVYSETNKTKRQIVLDEETLRALDLHLQVRGEDSEPALFLACLQPPRRIYRSHLCSLIHATALDGRAVHFQPHALSDSPGTEIPPEMRQNVLKKFGHPGHPLKQTEPRSEGLSIAQGAPDTCEMPKGIDD